MEWILLFKQNHLFLATVAKTGKSTSLVLIWMLALNLTFAISNTLFLPQCEEAYLPSHIYVVQAELEPSMVDDILARGDISPATHHLTFSEDQTITLAIDAFVKGVNPEHELFIHSPTGELVWQTAMSFFQSSGTGSDAVRAISVAKLPQAQWSSVFAASGIYTVSTGSFSDDVCSAAASTWILSQR